MGYEQQQREEEEKKKKKRKESIPSQHNVQVLSSRMTSLNEFGRNVTMKFKLRS